jgi:pimeloyl-ACP methyl ester carboxylesterase
VRVAFAAVGAAAATAAWCLTCAVKPFLILLLRKLVRSKEFWTKGLRAAIDPSRVDAMASDWIDGYRKPSVVRDWDVGMFRVVLASVVAASSPREIWRDAMARARATTQPSTLEREDAVNALVESGAKILIVHGENDVIVPASNSRTLAKLLNCELRILPKCGHMPHEESPEAFIDVLRDFIS